MSVLSEIRSLPGAIRSLCAGVEELAGFVSTLVELQGEQGTLGERLDELERTRARWEAEIDAQLLKADSTLKSAANAESRSRTMLRHAEKIVDPFDEDGEEVETVVSNGHDTRVEASEVLEVPVGLAPNNKAYAQRAKWMR